MSSHSIIDSLDDLENKINLLQKRIIGTEGIRPENGPTIEEMLFQSKTSLNEAVSPHSHIVDLLKRREELNRYLDPTFWDSFLDTVTKVQIILEAQEELRETINQLKQLNSLIDYSNTQVFQTVPESKAELATLTKDVLHLQDQSNKLKTAVKCLMVKYMNIIKYTNQVMLQLTVKVVKMEDSLEQAKSYD